MCEYHLISKNILQIKTQIRQVVDYILLFTKLYFVIDTNKQNGFK
jgi:hypothetical protein